MPAPLTERVAEILRDHPELNQTELGVIARVSKGLVSQWLTGAVKSMKDEAAQNLNARYGYALPWLLTGSGPKMDGRLTARDVDPEELQFHGKQIPVVGYVLGGDKGFFDEMGHATGHGEGYVTYPTKDPNTYALRVRGDSMRPRMKPGEYIVVMPNHDVTSGDEVVVRTTDGRVMVKKLGSRRHGIVELQSINESDFAPITLEESEIEKMHYVGGIAKDYLYRTSM